ncbi:MAG: tetratricopeptide repeat protein [Oscillibacter sp.]|nr:tetratricopeptide repeat protein [Oscillibacter sp.]
MGSFLKSFFGSRADSEEKPEEKENERKFNILKYDGVKALKMGKTGYAVRCFKEALNFREEAETLEYLAMAYIQQGENNDAIEAYTRLTILAPEDTDTFLKRAQLYLQEGDNEEAIKDCQYVLQHSPDYRAFLLMANAQNKLGATEEAINNLTQAAGLKNDVMDIFLLRTAIYCKTGQYDKALEDINKTIELAPEEETAYMQRAKIQECFQDYEAALQDYATVTELNPFHEQAYLESSRILMGNQRIDEAIQYLDEALEIKPDFGKAYLARAEAKKSKGDNEGAQQDIETGNALCCETEEEVKRPVNFDNLYANRPL